MNIVHYHGADIDGHSSGAMVRLYLEREEEKFFMKSTSYNTRFDLEKIKKTDTIWLLDCVPSDFIENAEDIIKKAGKVIICDHHKTLGEKLELLYLRHTYPNFRCEFDVTISGAENTFHYLLNNCNVEYIDQSRFIIELISVYDTFNKEDMETFERAERLNTGLQSYQTDPIFFMKLWRKILIEESDAVQGNYHDVNNFIEETIMSGEAINNFLAIKNKKNAELSAFTATNLATDKCFICINSQDRNSALFEGLYDEEIHHAMIAFSYSPRWGWSASIYSNREDVDCSEVAMAIDPKKGGGHKGAAGFNFDSFYHSNYTGEIEFR